VIACGSPAFVYAQLRAEIVATGFTQPFAVLPDPAVDGLFYVVERGGLVKAVHNGQLLATPFADFTADVSLGGERGLLSMAFAPAAETGRVFFAFANVNGDFVIARARRSAAYLTVDPSSRLDLQWPTGQRWVPHPHTIHYGGNLMFGPDGYLYVGLGDGGSPFDAENNAQNPATLLGKMLRLDVNVSDADPIGYRVPADNPFVDGNPIAALPEIWSIGLRNPWRFSFDDHGPGATRAMLMADVGQHTREEINYEPEAHGGRNYGWRIREGRIPLPGGLPTVPAFLPLTEPLFDYALEGRAVTGGFAYRGISLPAPLRGRYFFADFTTSRVWSIGLAIDPASGAATVRDVLEHTGQLGEAAKNVTSFGRDRQGELYLVSYGGTIAKIVPDVASTGGQIELTSEVDGSAVRFQWRSTSGQVFSTAQLEAGSASGQADLAVMSVTGNTLTVEGVPSGTYFVRLRAVGAAGEAAVSEELVVTVGGACSGTLLPPANLAATVTGSEVTLTWDAVPGATTLDIAVGSVAGAADLALSTVPGNTRTLQARAPSGEYFVRLASRNSCGVSAPSAELHVRVP
jgi:hypothetical protein